MSTGHRCATWALAGALLGVAIVAYGQDPPPPTSAPAVDPTLPVLVDLLRSGGLPAVLALLGWLAQRGGIPIVIRLHEDDRRLFRRPRPRDPDDSDNPQPKS